MSLNRTQTVLIGGLCLLLGFALVTGVAVAQESDNETNSTDNETTTIIEQVDEDVRVTDYEYRDAATEDGTGEFRVILENTGDTRTQVTITEVIDPNQDGAGKFGVTQRTLSATERAEVVVSASRNRGTAGIMITTEKSLANNEGTYLQDSQGFRTGLFSGGPSWWDVRIALAAGVGFAIPVMILGSWHIVSKKQNDQKEVSI